MMTAGPAIVAAGCSSENIYLYQEQNCGKKDSPSDCRDCCEYYCRPWHEAHCDDEFDSCVDDVSTCIQGVYKRPLALVCVYLYISYKSSSEIYIVLCLNPSHYSFASCFSSFSTRVVLQRW